MLKRIFQHDNIDNLVFENREKKYGAYFLRSSYQSILLKSLFSAAVFFVGFWFILLLITIFSFEKSDNSRFVYADISGNLNQNMINSGMLMPPPQAKSEDLNFQIVEQEINKPDEQKDEEKKDTENSQTDSLQKSGIGIGNQNNNGNSGQTYNFVEQMPEFPGGTHALKKKKKKNTNYPIKALQRKLSGVVYVKFCVSYAGDVTQISIAKGIDSLLDKEAIQVVKTMPRWKPGVQDGVSVNVWCTLPIYFVPLKS